ncbi:MAG: PTS sugar transporter subunit IIC [Gemmatimonadota bacterium]
MNEIATPTILALIVWGTLVGLDLVSVPQAMIARPLVAGSVAGIILGDVEMGLRVGIVMELFALDVLPVGAVRYPDYGPGTVGATCLATWLAGADGGWREGLGPGVMLGLVLGALGGWSLQQLRHANARSIQGRSAGLAAGESSAIRQLQHLGIARDVLRSAALTALAVGGAGLVAKFAHFDSAALSLVSLLAVASGLAAALGGAVRSAGRGPRLRWLAAGLGIGTVWAALR